MRNSEGLASQGGESRLPLLSLARIADAIAAFHFGHGEGAFDFSQYDQRRAAFALCDANTGGESHAIFADIKGPVEDSLAHTFRRVGEIFSRAAGQHDKELILAIASSNVVATQVAFEALADSLENLIAGGIAVVEIDKRKAVEVKEQVGEGSVHALDSVCFAEEQVEEAFAGEQAGEGVMAGVEAGCGAFFADALRQRLDALGNAETDLQVGFIQGLEEEIVRAGFDGHTNAGGAGLLAQQH